MITPPKPKLGKTTTTALTAQAMLEDGRALTNAGWAAYFGMSKRAMSQLMNGMKDCAIYRILVIKSDGELHRYQMISISAVTRKPRCIGGAIDWNKLLTG